MRVRRSPPTTSPTSSDSSRTDSFWHRNSSIPRGDWRDDPGVPSYYADGKTGGKRDEFADIFAWLVTSPARVQVKGEREEDF